MCGVPISEPTNIRMDNEAVYKSASVSDSTLKKKHVLIAYHICRKYVATGTIRVTKEGTDINVSDLFTKILAGPRREYLLNLFTY